LASARNKGCWVSGGGKVDRKVGAPAWSGATPHSHCGNYFGVVPRGGIEPPTRGFSVRYKVFQLSQNLEFVAFALQM